ncbi:MAG: GNAT family N-acetyltransferase [Gaiellaceae bacterium]|jgi:RimJ/RimL family protein N-acetyltransferase
MKPVLLDDGVILLRPWRDSDLGAAVEICQDAEIVRWTRVPSPYGEEDGRRFLAQAKRSFESGTEYAFAVVGVPDRVLLGSVSVKLVADGVGEVGYFVGAGIRRRGIGKRAVRLISRWALEDLGLARLQITVLGGNIASQRLRSRRALAVKACSAHGSISRASALMWLCTRSYPARSTGSQATCSFSCQSGSS